MSKATRPTTFVLLAALSVTAFGNDRLLAQVEPAVVERLRRDQDEILRKAERMRALMDRLQQRYEREGKQDQVALLRQGLEHLDKASLLRDVASIRDDLAAAALTEALRKQQEVVDELERLLNILLERKSVENLDAQMQLAAEQAATAAELAARQAALQQETRETLRGEPSPAEQQLLDALRDLQQQERVEAQRNAQQAGSRRPFLESALQRVQALLRQQDRLETGLRNEAEGRNPATRQRQFDLGELVQRTRELNTQLRDEQKQQEVGAAARRLAETAEGNDTGALQEARDALDRQLQDAPKTPGGPEGPQRDPKWAELRTQLERTPQGSGAAERDALQELAQRATATAAERGAEARERNAADAERLQQAAARLQETMQQAQPPASSAAPPAPEQDAAAALQEGQQRLAEADAAARQGDLAKARAKADQAQSAFERARSLDRQQNPEPQQEAARMAAEAAAAANELRNAPSAGDAEQQAAERMRQAEQALRQAEQGLEQDRSGRPADAEAAQRATQQSRSSLEDAARTLGEALQQANQGREQELAASQQRQQDLQQATERLEQQMQGAQSSGQITEPQQRAAAEQMQRARQAMQRAQQQLQQGQQASASGQQQEAADALQQAAEALEQNRPMTEAQRDALQQQAKKQQDLAEDILRLAQELKERENKRAQRAVDEAADAAQKAQRAMEQGDEEAAQQEQDRAREKLEEAAQQLEEEKDRYQDLRQEELLFKMKEELTTFLDRQKPITAQTLELQAAAKEGLSRPARRKLNQLGEEEQELAGRIEFLVQALTDEGNLVYRAVLGANLEDLREVARRLVARVPDPGSYTTLLQQDVERRTQDLLLALERERQRREEERRQQQQQQQQQAQQSKNKFNQQRQQLVSLIAELEMLKRLGTDTRRATDDLRTLVELRGDETISDAEVALVERLAHRHAEITRLFEQIRAGVMQAMQQGQQGNEEEGQGGRGR